MDVSLTLIGVRKGRSMTNMLNDMTKILQAMDISAAYCEKDPVELFGEKYVKLKELIDLLTNIGAQYEDE